MRASVALAQQAESVRRRFGWSGVQRLAQFQRDILLPVLAVGASQWRKEKGPRQLQGPFQIMISD
jgi:hypothetical protein